VGEPLKRNVMLLVQCERDKNMLMTSRLLLVTAFMLLAPQIASACGCMPSMLETERQRILRERKSSQAIFSGKVLSIEISRGVYWAVKFKVERAWKYVDSQDVVIFTMSPDGASCGVDFILGENYLVYAGIAFENELWTNHCTRTQKLRYAHRDLLILGAGKRPKAKVKISTLQKHNERLERTRHERAFLLRCVGEPLKRSVRQQF
jgi:hypothetical protein